jgi:hemolysin activation/secretion protein
LLLALIVFLVSGVRADCADNPPTFVIKSFVAEGNTLFEEERIQEILGPYKGPKRTAQDVETARNALEKAYHDAGYPAVLVNIPEQTVEEGRVRLQVVESKIGNVRVTGNSWYTRTKILRDLPSLAPGKVLYVPMVQKDLQRINRGQDFKASPVLSPGAEIGLTDVEIKVEDRLPLHGSLELNNRSTHDTSDLRLNATLRYDNLWQRDHSIYAQFQTSPERTDEVKLYALSYTFPAPWMRDHQIALYGLRSDSNTTTFGQGLLITGKGTIVGTRYVVPLTPYKFYAHNITLGVDYKDFEETVGFDKATGIKTPVSYAPLSFAYAAFLPDKWGMTRFSSGLNVAFRGLVTDQREFEVKRYNARGNYMFWTAGVERTHNLPAEMSLFLKVDGQIADQPLVSNEQYTAGGIASVRGYKEAEALGDNAFHAIAELSMPDLWRKLTGKGGVELFPYVFYDYAWLEIGDPLDGQRKTVNLAGVGAGVRGTVFKNVYCEAAVGFPLVHTEQTESNRERWYFKVGVQF